jgi:Ser/Thr protein kinase RdoA (MazF antagonist)/endonuclease/exonuclease/phosphatase family metal-dependent hydrolase
LDPFLIIDHSKQIDEVSGSMPLFPRAPPVPRIASAVQRALETHYSILNLAISPETPIKASQNTTWGAKCRGETQHSGEFTHVVRATPDSDGDFANLSEFSPSHARIAIELRLLAFLGRDPDARKRLRGEICCPVQPEVSQDATAHNPERENTAPWHVPDASAWAVRVPLDNSSEVRSAEGGEATHITVAVFEFSRGKPVDLAGTDWATDLSLARKCGAFLGSLHALTREFAAKTPEWAGQVRAVDELHDGLLAPSLRLTFSSVDGDAAGERDVEGVVIASPLLSEDIEAFRLRDPQRVGVLHGDLNASNFFVVDGLGDAAVGDASSLSVFDWDQLQLGFWEYDLAQTLFAVHMLGRAGAVLAGTPVELANDESCVVRALVSGYEAESGRPVALHTLQRMVELRRVFYETFCRRAVQELAPEGELIRTELEGMFAFMKYIVGWFDRERAALRCRVMTYNVLARPYTKYNTAFHRNASPVETLEQTQARYRLATEEILREAPDAVCLQECEQEFVDPATDSNPAAASLLDAYQAVSCFGPPSPDTGLGTPGTVVLIRREAHGGRLSCVVTTGSEPAVFRVEGSSATGGTSKSAVGVLCQFADATPLVVISLHATTTRSARARQHQMSLISSALESMFPAGERPLVCVCGDFNGTAEDLARDDSALLNGLSRVEFGVDTGCGANFDRPHPIDHMFVSPTGLLVESLRAERPPSSPYAIDAATAGVAVPAAVSGPSDHVWLSAELVSFGRDWPTVLSPWPAALAQDEPATGSVRNPAANPMRARGQRGGAQGRGRGHGGRGWRGRGRGRGGSSESSAGSTSRPLCHYVSSAQGCRHGSQCRFSHES